MHPLTVDDLPSSVGSAALIFAAPGTREVKIEMPSDANGARTASTTGDSRFARQVLKPNPGQPVSNPRCGRGGWTRIGSGSPRGRAIRTYMAWTANSQLGFLATEHDGNATMRCPKSDDPNHARNRNERPLRWIGPHFNAVLICESFSRCSAWPRAAVLEMISESLTGGFCMLAAGASFVG